tara:strand:+ start:121 stop:459 length:339 start_codon:yes stop_codon:yes gene_type:complete
MKKLLFTTFVVILLFSCNQTSQKGAWNSTDKETCLSENKIEFQNDTSFSQLLSLLNKTLDEFVECGCTTLEKNYENFNSANEASEQELGKLYLDCLGEEFQKLINEEYRLEN